MDIVQALKHEEGRLLKQLNVVREAISALRVGTAGEHIYTNGRNGAGLAKRTMSAEARAKISRSAKARWAKIKADKIKKAK